MIEDKRVLAVVPARGGSKGLPGKNLKNLCGKPLLGWSIDQGLACEYIDTLIVSTDSEEIAAIAENHGASVPFIRPADLAVDEASSVDVVLHAIDFMRKCGKIFEYVVLLEPTSPLRDVSDIVGALELLAGKVNLSSVVGVAKMESFHPTFSFVARNGLLRPVSPLKKIDVRRQDLVGNYFYPEGSIYVSDIFSIKRKKSFYHEATAPWVVARYKAIEIDELSDFIAVESLMKAKLDGILK